jgi:hypothetical protein
MSTSADGKGSGSGSGERKLGNTKDNKETKKAKEDYEEDEEGDEVEDDEDDDNDDANDYGDDDDQPIVKLGFIEAVPHPLRFRRQYFPSKVGGKPVYSSLSYPYLIIRYLNPHTIGMCVVKAWLNPRDLPTSTQLTCDVCKSTLRFLLQVTPFPSFHYNTMSYHTIYTIDISM